jgi:hypothetical protein
MNRSVFLVRNAVLPAVNDLSTDGPPPFVHTFASCHPLRDAQGSLGPHHHDSIVIPTGYDVLHSVHRTYLI